MTVTGNSTGKLFFDRGAADPLDASKELGGEALNDLGALDDLEDLEHFALYASGDLELFFDDLVGDLELFFDNLVGDSVGDF